MPKSDDTHITLIEFRGNQLIAVRRGDAAHIAVKRISDRFGLEWSAQLKRIKRTPILAEAMAVMAMPMASHGQETTLLRLDRLNFWLAGIDVNRVDEGIRDEVLAYQRECADVLHRHFFGEPTGAKPADGERWKLAKVAEARRTFGHKAAQQMYFALGLMRVPAMHEQSAQREMFGGEPGDNVIPLLLPKE